MHFSCFTVTPLNSRQTKSKKSPRLSSPLSPILLPRCQKKNRLHTMFKIREEIVPSKFLRGAADSLKLMGKQEKFIYVTCTFCPISSLTWAGVTRQAWISINPNFHLFIHFSPFLPSFIGFARNGILSSVCPSVCTNGIGFPVVFFIVKRIFNVQQTSTLYSFKLKIRNILPSTYFQHFLHSPKSGSATYGKLFRKFI